MESGSLLEKLLAAEHTYKHIFEKSKLRISYNIVQTLENTTTCIELHRNIINIGSLLVEKYTKTGNRQQLKQINLILERLHDILEPLNNSFIEIMRRIKIMNLYGGMSPVKRERDHVEENEDEIYIREEVKEEIEEQLYDIPQGKEGASDTLCVQATGLVTECIAKLFKNILTALAPLFQTYNKKNHYPLLVHVYIYIYIYMCR